MGSRLPKPVRLLGWVSLLTDAATEAVYPLLPVFITQVLGGPPVALGIVEGAADATSSALKVVSGRWSDRLGARKPIVLLGYTLSSVVRPFIAITTSWAHVFAIRVTDRVGKGLRSSPRDAMLASLAPPGERGRVFGYHWAMDHAGAAVGPLLATIFLYFSPDNYRLLFALTIIPGALAVFILLRVPEVVDTPKGVSPHASSDGPSGPSIGKPLKTYLWIFALFTLGNSSDAFLLLQLSHAGVPLMGLTLLWSAQHAIKALITMKGGMLSDRLGRRTLIISGWLIYAVVYAGFALSQSVYTLITWFLFYSAYAAAVEGSEKALVADLTPEHLRATAYGWYAAVQGFGALAAGIFFGLLWQFFGAPVAFLTGASLALLAALLLALAHDVHGRRDH
ncbi:MAG TPA: MFS transporter [Vicinamibacterales bacterium]|nr:MFS transporter [Vicinamibacterales bacterium]